MFPFEENVDSKMPISLQEILMTLKNYSKRSKKVKKKRNATLSNSQVANFFKLSRNDLVIAFGMSCEDIRHRPGVISENGIYQR